MNPFFRWTRFPMALVLLSTAFLLNCGSEGDEDIVVCAIPSISYGPTAGCDLEANYQQGIYMFTAVQPIVDECGGGILVPGIESQTLAIDLPALVSLPKNITVNVPVVGNVAATFSHDVNEIKFAGSFAGDVNNPLQPAQTFYVEAVVVGSICFDTAGSPKAKLALVLEAINPGIFPACCVVTASLTGQLQP